MGIDGPIRRGGIQYMTAGTSVLHNLQEQPVEFCPYNDSKSGARTSETCPSVLLLVVFEV